MTSDKKKLVNVKKLSSKVFAGLGRYVDFFSRDNVELQKSFVGLDRGLK